MISQLFLPYPSAFSFFFLRCKSPELAKKKLLILSFTTDCGSSFIVSRYVWFFVWVVRYYCSQPSVVCLVYNKHKSSDSINATGAVAKRGLADRLRKKGQRFFVF